MKKKVPVVTVAEPEEAARLAGLLLEATVALADVAGAVKDGLLGFCANVGLVVMRQLMEAELTARVGPKHAKLADPHRQRAWSRRPTQVSRLGAERRASTSSSVRKETICRCMRLAGMASSTRWISAPCSAWRSAA